MKSIKITKQLYYKQARFLQPSQLTLQDLLRRALKKLPVEKRHESVVEVPAGGEGQSQEWLRLINSPRASAGFQFGVMVLFSPSLHHMVISTAIKADTDELDVSKMPPPAGKQFMETPLYFAIRDNHIVIVQSKSLRVDAFESHLNWLLQTAGCIDETQRIELSDTIPEETRKKMGEKPVKKITLAAPFFDTAAVPIATEKKKGARLVRVAATGVGLAVLKSILPAKQYEALKVNEMTDLPDIRVNVEIRVMGRSKPEHEHNKVMRTIMSSMRHVEDVNFLNVEVDGIGTIKGQSLRVHDHRSIDSFDGVLVTSDCFEVMRRWLESLVDKGTVRVDS